MPGKDYGRTPDGEPITDALVERLADKAERGFDTDEIIRRRGGRPPLGSSAASVESVRLDPDLRDALYRAADGDLPADHPDPLDLLGFYRITG